MAFLKSSPGWSTPDLTRGSGIRTGEQGGVRLGTAKQPGLGALTGAEGCQLLSHCFLGCLPKLPRLKVKQLHFLDSLGFRLYQGEHKLKWLKNGAKARESPVIPVSDNSNCARRFALQATVMEFLTFNNTGPWVSICGTVLLERSCMIWGIFWLLCSWLFPYKLSFMTGHNLCELACHLHT